VLSGGRIKVGNVLITPGAGGKVTVGTGAAQVTLDGTTGKVTAGNLTIDPTGRGGSVTFANGAQIYAFNSGAVPGQIELVSGNGSNAITLRDDKIAFVAPEFTSTRPTPAVEGDLEYLRWMAWDSRDGTWKTVDPGMGGPLGGPLEFPFSLATVTSEFGMREHPDGTGPRMHEGMDFAPPAGTPIPAAGSGVVASSGYSEGYGNEVWIDHGMIRGQRIRTHYAHMQDPGVAAGTALGKGAIVGLVGNTGASFGAHLHFEVEVDGVKVNPRDVISE
jgi:murein DD-endopeptidase MepM/ murein hydrolase activator NlpD